ncbi:MAG: oxygen-dependent coproporphyrinogen oxidase, partial [Gammaproteobacteria bacterium]
MAAKTNLAAATCYLRDLQTQLTAALQKADGGGKFAARQWQSKLGEGCAQTLEGGALFERAGVNFSAVGGKRLPKAALAKRGKQALANKPWQAAGVSVVCHPQNPFCPAAHLNVRVFVCGGKWWFGGGMDLTPSYAFAADCRHFHGVCKDALGAVLYRRFKRACDEYFYLPHRGEMRGIGGVFFDDFRRGGYDPAFSVMRAVGDSFSRAYLPIVRKRRKTPFGKQEREWQLYRRGRYAEFNLLYDRGTLFGLQSGGNADAILMSLPPLAKWGIPSSV